MRAAIAVVIATMTLGLAHRPLLAQTGNDWLYSMHMVDALNGWAINTSGWGGNRAKGAVGSIVRTTDGGIHWKDVTPRAPHGQYIGRYLSPVHWLTSLSAWVSTVLDTPNLDTAVLFHTVDGGRTWNSVTIPFSGFRLMDFINTRDGWLLAGNDDVHRSTDSGKTWIKVGSARFPGPARTRPNSITFLNGTMGWITGSNNARDGTYLLMTRDGGHTWQQQKLSLPTQVTPPWSFSGHPPTFFTAQEGILAQPYSIGHNWYVTVHVTRDGGTTWMRTTPPPVQGYSMSSFADVNHGWVTDWDALYATSDGGRQWTTIRPGSSLANVGELYFISPQLGWAVGWPLESPFLLKTFDGGRTWAPVTYTISRR